jgi:hypothetical protein
MLVILVCLFSNLVCSSRRSHISVVIFCIRIVVHSRRMSLSAEAGWSIVNTEPKGTTDVTKLGMEPDKLQPLQTLHVCHKCGF